MKHPFSVPSRLSPDLARFEAYWRGLLRGSAEMPFADDVNLANLPDLASRLFLVDVFYGPERFRFSRVGGDIGGRDLEGLFLDDTDLGWPFEFLRAQCTATVESGAVTFFQAEPAAERQAYARLLAPAWGEGRILLLAGLVDLD